MHCQPQPFAGPLWVAFPFALLCAWLVPGPAVAAAERLVRDGAQLAAAISAATPGDRIVMADGVWTDQGIVFKSLGTEQQPITLCAQTPGKVVLIGASNLKIGGRFLVVEGLCFRGKPAGPANSAVEFRTSRDEVASDCRLTQCAIIDYSPSDKTISTCYVVLYGQRNRVDHCYFRGKTNQSATLNVYFDAGAPPNYHRIDHNYFAWRPPLGVNGGETLQVGWSAAQHVNSRTTVECNYFEECNGEVEIITNKSCENVYRFNTFRRCQGALSLRVGNRCTVEGNFFIGQNAPRTGGVHVFGEDHKIINNYFAGLTGTKEKLGVQYGDGAALVLMSGSSLVSTGEPRVLEFLTGGMLHPQVKRAVVAFNTFVDCSAMVDIGLAFAPWDAVSNLRPTDCVVANNIVTGTPPDRVVLFSVVPEDLVCEGNLAWNGAADGAAPKGFTRADPKLTLDPAGFSRLSPGSPAIGAAIGDLPFIKDDIEGQPRAVDRKDVGCDQLSTAPVVRRPLTPNDVGPSWQ
jgi:poly(beta-D-mannuronate) lyase